MQEQTERQPRYTTGNVCTSALQAVGLALLLTGCDFPLKDHDHDEAQDVVEQEQETGRGEGEEHPDPDPVPVDNPPTPDVPTDGGGEGEGGGVPELPEPTPDPDPVPVLPEPDPVPEPDPEPEPEPEPICYTLYWTLSAKRENGRAITAAEISTVYVLTRVSGEEEVDWPTIVEHDDPRLTTYYYAATETEGCIDPTLYYNVAVRDAHGRFSRLSEAYDGTGD